MRLVGGRKERKYSRRMRDGLVQSFHICDGAHCDAEWRNWGGEDP